jgi:hypothetical protein
MPQPNDLSRSLALDQNSTIIAVVELSQSSWLVGSMLPGIERQNGCLPFCIAGGMRRLGPAALSRGLRLPSKPAATASGCALARGAWGRGARDPSLERRGITGTSPGENRPARH